MKLNRAYLFINLVLVSLVTSLLGQNVTVTPSLVSRSSVPAASAVY